MSAELRLSALNSMEGEIRTIVRGNRSASAAALCDDILAAGATSIAEIEKLMAELQTARDYLEAEGERVRRLTTRYAHLTQTASASVKVIAESLGKWRNPELEFDQPSRPELVSRRRTPARADGSVALVVENCATYWIF